MKHLYGLAYPGALDKESTLPHDETERRANVIPGDWDGVWKPKPKKASGKQTRSKSSL